MELQELLNSKVYVKQNGGMTFKTPDEYISPFIDMFSTFTNEFKIKTAAESVNANEDSSQNVAFGRVVVEAVLPPEFTRFEHYTTVGIMYSLDTQKPFLKAYTGQVAFACTNLSIFNADQIFAAEMTGNTQTVYDKLNKYKASLNEGLEEWSQMIRTLQDTMYDTNAYNEKVGYMLRRSMRANFTQGVTAMVKEIDNPKSVYAMRNGETSAWNVLSAATQYITDKTELTSKPDVTLFAHQLFGDELMRGGITLN